MGIIRSALGRYEADFPSKEGAARPNPDVIIGHSFGTEIGQGSVNRALADFILNLPEQVGSCPIIADRMLVNAFPDPDSDVDRIVEGPITNAIGQGVGTWGTLLAAMEFMLSEKLNHPLMIAQAHHVGRVVMQARRLDMEPMVPSGLPDHFDPRSGQRWTRRLGLWVPHEILGSLMLRAQRKL